MTRSARATFSACSVITNHNPVDTLDRRTALRCASERARSVVRSLREGTCGRRLRAKLPVADSTVTGHPRRVQVVTHRQVQATALYQPTAAMATAGASFGCPLRAPLDMPAGFIATAHASATAGAASCAGRGVRLSWLVRTLTALTDGAAACDIFTLVDASQTQGTAQGASLRRHKHNTACLRTRQQGTLVARVHQRGSGCAGALQPGASDIGAPTAAVICPWSTPVATLLEALAAEFPDGHETFVWLDFVCLPLGPAADDPTAIAASALAALQAAERHVLVADARASPLRDDWCLALLQLSLQADYSTGCTSDAEQPQPLSGRVRRAVADTGAVWSLEVRVLLRQQPA